MKLAILILHYQNIGDTLACLESIKKIETDLNPEIWLISNSPTQVKELQTEVLNLNLGSSLKINWKFNQTSLSFAESYNQTIELVLQKSTADHLLFLNNDTTLDPYFFKKIKLESNPQKPQVITVQMRNYYQPTKIDNLGLTFNYFLLAKNRIKPNQKLLGPSGGAAIYNRAALAKIKKPYFDPQFAFYLEDTDLAIKARLQKIKINYQPEAIIYHKVSATAGTNSSFKIKHSWRNNLWLYLKYFPVSYLIIRLPYLLLGQLTYLAFSWRHGYFLLPLKVYQAAWQGRQTILKQRKVTNFKYLKPFLN